jgi:ectoine hydroxylase-related dioxygenase (phytanoyl-CoA dioxygenase family)
MAAKTDPAKLVRQARDLIEEFNRVVLDDAKDLSAPALSEATQALKSLVERLPQAFEQTADVLEMLAAGDKVTVEHGRDSKSEVATTATELRGVAADSEQLAKSLANPASALFLMGGR